MESMKLVQMELTRSQIRTHTRPHPPLVRALARTLTLAAARLEVRWILLAAAPLWARQQPAPSFSLPGLLPGVSAPGSSTPWNIVVLLTLLTLIPAIVLSMTPFVRLLIVFHFLRQALGTQTTPSNQTLIGLSLVLTFFLMQPVGATIYTDAVVPLDAGRITMMTALHRSIVPMRHFILQYAREKDLALFVELAHEPRPARPEDLGMRIVAPAYLLSGLQAWLPSVAALFLPFLVLDLVTAAITTSVGMMQLPPVIISTRSEE